MSFTIVVSVVVATILMMMIMLVYYSGHERSIYRTGERLLRNVSSAEAWVMSQGTEMKYGAHETWDLYGDGIDSVSVLKFRWGVFDAFHVSAFRGIYYQESRMLLGSVPSEEGQSSIYLEDNRGALRIAGDTKISGVAYLPKAGIRSAYVNRVGYTRDKLIYGTEKVSEDKIPELTDFDHETVVSDLSFFPANELIAGEEDSRTKYTFRNDTLTVFKVGDYHLKDSLSGFVMIQSTGTVTLESEAYTEDIIVMANQIEFEKDFEGQGQFFASDTIIVNEKVKLHYPTVLSVENEKEPATIEVREFAEIHGVLMIDGDRNNSVDRLISLEDGSEIYGQIYANGEVTAYGEVNGHVCLRAFLMNTFSGVDKNQLFNAQFENTLDSAYLYPDLWFFSDRKGIVQWLN